MKVKLKHRLKDGRIIEIEGEPGDVIHTIRGLDREEGGKPHWQTRLKGAHAIKTDSDLSATTGRVRKKDIVDYINKLSSPDLKHSIRDLMLHFFGKVLDSTDRHSGYNNFYTMVIRAHKRIERDRNGLWHSDWVFDKDGRYAVYHFIRK